MKNLKCERHYCRSKRGFTLTEMAILFGVVGLVLGGVWVAAAHVWHEARTKTAIEEMVTVVQNMRDYFGTMGSLEIAPVGNCTNFMDNDDRKLVPVRMRKNPSMAGSGFVHALGGDFQILCPDNYSFSIRLQSVSRDSCIKFLTTFPLLSPAMGVKEILTNGTSRKIINVSSVSNTPITLSEATMWCGDAANNNEVRFVFKLFN